MTKQRINIQARINRHLRILKQNVSFESKTFKGGGKFGYNLSLSMIFIILIFPIYPSISNIVYTNTELEFDRKNIDESSILSSYEGIEGAENRDEAHLVEHIDSYVSVNTTLDANRDLTGVNEITKYKVRAGDSIASIAENFGVSRNTVLWANGMDVARELKIGEIIKVPSATGYLYKIKKGDSIEKIAQEYKISVEAIEKQNGIKNGYLIAGNEILLPGAAKIIPVIEKPKPIANNNTNNNTNKNLNKNSNNNTKKTDNKNQTAKSSNSTTKNTNNNGNTQYTGNSGTYNLVKRKPQWKFAWGNCTWYVAQYKNVNWGGNANQWIRNARAKGHATGTTPQVGAIVQFSGGGYNPTYGHVGIVIGIEGGNLIVSDMNYRRINEVTVRKVPTSHPAIDGYIYVN